MAETVLSAHEHFQALREAVWVRYCARHRGVARERFEDAYAEWWTRELARERQGTPSRAEAPAAFVAEAVHRVMIDEARARARGLGREEKHALDVVDLDEQAGAAAGEDTAAAAGYEALAHRVLTLVRGSLTERELRVFVWSFLYLQPSERTAEALGLSLPRVKKDRKKIATKVGAQVWAVLSGELDLCATYREQSLPAIFEILTVHVEDCPTCRSALGGVRRGALAVVGPEMLVLGTATEGATHVVTDLAQSAAARLHGLLHRTTETLVALPPSGRTAAAVAVAATAVAGGAATVVPEREPERRRDRALAEVQRAPQRQSAPASVTAIPTTPPPPAPVVAQPAETPEPRGAAPTPAAATPAAPTAAPPEREPITFEQSAPPASAAAPPPPPPPQSAPAPRSSAPSSEFGFEQP